MIVDRAGYRLGVGMILVKDRSVFWGQRIGQDTSRFPQGGQFPQGGLKAHETVLDALYRELKEEVGLESTDVQVLGSTQNWFTYRLPDQFLRVNSRPLVIGQKQQWFLLQLLSPDRTIQLNSNDPPEFSDWRWIPYWEAPRYVVFFKQAIYQAVLEELFPHIADRWTDTPEHTSSTHTEHPPTSPVDTPQRRARE